MALASTKVNSIRFLNEGKWVKDLTAQMKGAYTKRVNNAVPKIKSTVANIIRSRLEAHPVIRSLRGGKRGDRTGSDLPAEFGLEDGVGDAVSDRIISILSDGRSIGVKPNITEQHNAVRFYIKWISDEYKERILNIVGSSGPGGTPLDWVELILDDPRPGIGNDDYGIIFGDNMLFQERSRSKRALMLPEGHIFIATSKYARVPWDIPDIIVPFSGENFIEDSIATDQFAEIVRSMANNLIREAVSR